MRCSAASTSAMTPRRSSSDCRSVLLAGVERLEPVLRRRHLGLDRANPRRRVDQLLIELAAVLADRLDLAA